MSHVSGRKEIPTINHGQHFIMNNFGSYMYARHDILLFIVALNKRKYLVVWIMRIFQIKTMIVVHHLYLLGSARSNWTLVREIII